MSAPPVIVWLRPGVGFEPDAAKAFQRMEAAAGRQIDVNSSYRDWMTQYKLWAAYQNHVPGAPYALHPDDSMHCKGLAFDTDDQTLVTSLPQYGWRRTALAVDEPWHCDYLRVFDEHYGEPADSGSQPFPIPLPTDPPDLEENEDMTPRQIHYSKSGSVQRALIVPGTGYFVPWTEGATSVYANAIAKNMETGASTEVTESLYNAFKTAAALLQEKS